LKDQLRGTSVLQPAEFVLLDVRNDDEFHAGHIAGALHIPLPQLPLRLQELHKHTSVIVYCKGGGRSARAADLLVEQGFGNVSNLTGGITAWARDIDKTVLVY
jgi:rhodanese-related sulfurtransferase